MFANRSKTQFVVAFAVVAVLMLSAVAAFAQATPEAYTSTTLLDSAGDMLGTWNLWPFVIAFAVVGLIAYILRRLVRTVR